MSVEQSGGLTIPERPEGEVSKYRAFEFVRQVFILNDCLERMTTSTDDYFTYGTGDRGPKSDQFTAYYWGKSGAATGLPLVFDAKFSRFSQEEAELKQAQRRRESSGFESEVPVGQEFFRVTRIEPSNKLNVGKVVFGASFVHTMGTGNSYSVDDQVDIFGSVWTSIERNMLASASNAHIQFIGNITQSLLDAL